MTMEITYSYRLITRRKNSRYMVRLEIAATIFLALSWDIGRDEREMVSF